jgi:dTDP-4-amino-4,6-dideoxygalactose transaminase
MGNYGDFWGRSKVTNSQHISEKLSILAGYGTKPKYYCKVTGEKFRFDALPASILIVKLERLDEWTEKRKRSALQKRF